MEKVMLNVQTRNLPGVLFICLQGHLVNGHTTPLREVVNSELAKISSPARRFQNSVQTIVLDFSRVNTVDAGGLGALLELRAQIQSHGIDFKFMNVNRLIGMVFKITRLDTVFEISSAAELLPATSHSRRVTLAELASCA